MPRSARIKSQTGIYHIMLRGINKQVVFAEEKDKIKFLDIIKFYKESCNFKLYAYCLMDNHIHLLLKEESDPIDVIIKKVGSKFVYWYNLKYDRSGHLFQDRFKSESVETDEYFLTVLRYIHQNPIKAGLSKSLSYRYSSYDEYIDEYGSDFVDSKDVLERISLAGFEELHQTECIDKCLDIPDASINNRLNDDDAQRIFNKISKTNNINEFQLISPDKQTTLIIKCRNKGISFRQLSRMTGLSKGIIEKILKTGDGSMS